MKSVDSHISEKLIRLKEQIATLEKREERYMLCRYDYLLIYLVEFSSEECYAV